VTVANETIDGRRSVSNLAAGTRSR
jgi:hypothetical protein